MTTGDFVKIKRIKARKSARELSLSAGLSPSYVSKLEAGTIEASLKAFSKLAVALGLSAAEVIFVVKSESNSSLAPSDSLS